MFAQINHMAMISPQYPLLQKYYQSLFRLQVSTRPFAAHSGHDPDGNWIDLTDE